MPALGYAIFLVGTIVVASFIGMGPDRRKKFWNKGL